MIKKSDKGFTIIEIIVVIATIGVLATIIITSVNQYVAKARDVKRIADINQIQKALEMYYADYGSYPVFANSWYSSYDSSWATLQTALQPYLSKLPVDPKNESVAANSGGLTYGYYTNPAGEGCLGQWYMIVYNLEVTSEIGPGSGSCTTRRNYSSTVTTGICKGSTCK